MYSAKILADSKSPSGSRLTTFEVSYPRFIHGEMLTHRVFSRNSSSSRAIPIAHMLENVKKDPVLPTWWGRNQAGMQAVEELSLLEVEAAKRIWLEARDSAVRYVESLMAIGLHKQISNRVLEPWMWITVLISATDWGNFFSLRCHKDAQPEMRRIAEMMHTLQEGSTPVELGVGSWHLPLVDDLTTLSEKYSEEDIVRVSTGRAARVSYVTHLGVRDPQADIDLCTRLSSSGHWSPFEHAAQALPDSSRIRNYTGWRQYRSILDERNIR